MRKLIAVAFTFMLSACAFVLYAGTLFAQQPDWMIGEWTAVIQDWPGGSPDRYMTIKSIQPNGTVVGTWGTSPDKPGRAIITTTGDEITVITASNVRVQLKRDGDRAVGTFTLENGKAFPVSLSKGFGKADTIGLKGSTSMAGAFDGHYKGNATAPAGCASGQMDATIKGNQITGTFTMYSNDGSGESRLTGKVDPNTGEAVFSLTRLQGNTYTGTRLTARIEGDKFEIELKGRNCSQAFKLTRASLE